MSVLLGERHLLEVTPETAAADRYPVIPVDVPAAAAEIRVSYEVVDGDGRIDIGLCDPRGPGPGLPGFRGWSGSARSSFTLRATSATPGYLPGPLPAGRWSILLGLYRVPEPCAIAVAVEVDDEESPVELGEGPRSLAEARQAPVPAPRVLGGMVAGDLHTHTVHSGDAARPIPVASLVADAESAGLSFLAVTDHNTVSHHAALAALQVDTPVRLLRGQEVTSYRGHFNVWGAAEVVDFRIGDSHGLISALGAVAEMGGVASICHPKTVGPPWELPLLDGLSAVEAWGAPWPWANGESLQFWDRLLRRGHRLTAVGGSDIHDFSARRGHGLATPTTWLPVGDDPAQAIVAGRIVLSQAPEGPVAMPLGPDGDVLMGATVAAGTPLRARVHGGAGGRLRAVGPRGLAAEADIDDPDQEVVLGGLDQAWLRLELWGPGLFSSGPVAGRVGSLWSLSNPVWSA